jgi:hypothetical protein
LSNCVSKPSSSRTDAGTHSKKYLPVLDRVVRLSWNDLASSVVISTKRSTLAGQSCKTHWLVQAPPEDTFLTSQQVGPSSIDLQARRTYILLVAMAPDHCFSSDCIILQGPAVTSDFVFNRVRSNRIQHVTCSTELRNRVALSEKRQPDARGSQKCNNVDNRQGRKEHMAEDAVSICRLVDVSLTVGG